MKLLPSRPDTAITANLSNVRAVALRPPVNESTRLAFLARMAVYSRSLSPDLQSTSTPEAGRSNSLTSISSNSIIAGVLGAVAALLICAGILVAVRIRYHRGPGFWTRSPRSTSGTGTANSQKTLCNPEDGFAVAKTPQAGVMKGNASFLSENSQVEWMEEMSIGNIAARTNSRRPTIGIDTSQLPCKIRRSLMDPHNYFLEQRRGPEMNRGTAIGPTDESNFGDETSNRNSMLSTYSLSLQLSRHSTSLSQASVQTVSPIAFSDTPSTSHLPLALRPKVMMSRPEADQLHINDTPDSTSSAGTST